MSGRRSAVIALLLATLALAVPRPAAAEGHPAGTQKAPALQLHKTYLGFDSNLYPGNLLLPRLHKHFAYLGYWLNNPPGMSTNEWAGKRAAVLRAGFGFLLLFNGRLDATLRHTDAAALGAKDGVQAAHAAKAEGFPPGAVIFLDLEEGGRMLPEQLAYVRAWIHGVRAGGYAPGVYCSGIMVRDAGQIFSTADDIAAHFPGLAIWVANDRCPPAPGCVAHAPRLSQSGFRNALVWQFAQSPRRRALTRACRQTYARDGNCYAPGLPHNERTAVDFDSSSSPDPSGGR